MNTEDGYEDIISMPHHVSDRHPHMPMHKRAAQFAPFAALTGFGESIEKAREKAVKEKALSPEEEKQYEEDLKP
ncbi:MAG: hypothetical protein K6E33_02285 [Lachnospiraceae bacterium]|nr:hypothetical protein [Lachnospiraceae bacterium]